MSGLGLYEKMQRLECKQERIKRWQAPLEPGTQAIDKVDPGMCRRNRREYSSLITFDLLQTEGDAHGRNIGVREIQAIYACETGLLLGIITGWTNAPVL